MQLKQLALVAPFIASLAAAFPVEGIKRSPNTNTNTDELGTRGKAGKQHDIFTREKDSDDIWLWKKGVLEKDSDDVWLWKKGKSQKDADDIWLW